MAEKQSLQEWLGRERGQVALVFTDIIGSTAWALQVGDPDWIIVLKEHFTKARDLMQKHSGFEVKLIGDSCMVVFHTAGPALQFALDLAGETDIFVLPTRAAVHVGEVEVFGNDIYGTMINYTSRVLKAAAIAPSRVVMSYPVYQQVLANMGKVTMRSQLRVARLAHECLNEFPANQRELYEVSRNRRSKIIAHPTQRP
jgi:class 3 adenylate cyclase